MWGKGNSSVNGETCVPVPACTQASGEMLIKSLPLSALKIVHLSDKRYALQNNLGELP